MYRDRRLETRLADIIEPVVDVMAKRFSNNGYNVGSRVVNPVPCPFCTTYLQNNCRGCPLDEEFGQQDGIGYDGSGCKVVIRRLWGDFTFGDYPDKIIRTRGFNPQLEQMHNFAMSIIPVNSIKRLR